MAYQDDDRPRRVRSAEGPASGAGRAPRGDRPARPTRSSGTGDDRQRNDRQRDDRQGGERRFGGARSQGSDRPQRGDRQGRGAAPERASTHKEWANTRRNVEVEHKLAPLIPDEITDKDIEIGVRAQLKTLTPENAEKVARHLAMVALLIDEDPELAHQHAVAAADRAGRIAVVRETLGCTAYATGDFTLALRELLTHRRISGSNEQIALIVDSERGLGRPERGLEAGRLVEKTELSPSARVNLAIAMSGARLDLGEKDLALSELEIAELNPSKVFDYSPALFFAYADVLEDLGREKDAKRWADLGNRAIAALGATEDEDETVTVLEEIEIPVRREWSPEERAARAAAREQRGGDRPRRFGGDADRGGERSFGRDGERGGGRGGERSGGRGGERSGERRGFTTGRSDDRRGNSERPTGRPAGERGRSTSRDDYRPKRNK